MLCRLVTVTLVFVLASCSPGQPEQVQLRGLDGELLEAGEMQASDSPVTPAEDAIDETGPPAALAFADLDEDGWISPKFSQTLSVAGTNLTQYVYLSPYTKVPGEWTTTSCAAHAAFETAEDDATIEAGVYRATGDGIRSAGEEGTILHAHAVSFATMSDTVGETYLNIFRTCSAAELTVESDTRTIDTYGQLEVLTLSDPEDHRPLRVAYMKRANIVMFLVASVESDDEMIYDAFLDKAAEKLTGAVFEEEIGPDDFTPELLALEEELANSLGG